MDDFDTLQEFDAESFPLLKSMLELDGLTLEKMLKKSNYEPFCYSKKRQGWFEWLSYAGLTYLVLIHGESKQFAWKDVYKWVFHPNVKKLCDPDFEVWMNSNSNRKED